MEPKRLDDVDAVYEYLMSEQVNRTLPFKSKLASVVRLSGGYANYVYRLKFEDGSTAVQKYYAPFLAKGAELGELGDSPITQKRYFIERDVLNILGSDPCFKDCLAKTPHVLWHDDTHFTFIMEDCGERCITLSDLLEKDFKIPDFVPNVTNKDEFVNEILDLFAREMSKHFKKLTMESQLQYEKFKDKLDNREMFEEFMKLFPSILQNHAKQTGLEAELAEYMKNFKQEMPEKLYFNQMDCWPNGLMIDLEKRIFWVLDWEMSRFHTSYGDYQQLCSTLWLYKESRNYHNERTSYLLDRFQHYYYDGEKDASWITKCGEPAESKVNFLITAIFRMLIPTIEIDKREVTLKAMKIIKD